MSLHFIISFQVQQQKRQAFEDLLHQVKTDLPKVEGCTGVTILSNLEDPTHFTLVETWESREQHQANSQKLAASGDWDYILGLLDEEPSGIHYKET